MLSVGSSFRLATVRHATLRRATPWCGVVWCGVVRCGVVWCGVVWCGVVWCCVVCRRRCYQKAMAGSEGNGRVYPRVQVNGRAVCLSARCVLVCCCTVGTSAQLHWAGAALPTPVHGHTGSIGLTAPRVLRCTTSTLCAVLHCLVLCTALHCVCRAALNLWAVGSGSVALRRNALPYCLWAVGSANPAMHRHTARGQWAVQLLQCTATLPGGSGQCNSCNTPPHCLGAVGSGTPAMHCHTAWGQWAGTCCNAPPHCLGHGAVGSGTAAMHCHTVWGQWAVHCHTAWGQWAVGILQCTATLPGGTR